MNLRTQLGRFRNEHEQVLRFLSVWEGALQLAATGEEAERWKGLMQLRETEKQLMSILEHCSAEEWNVESPFVLFLDWILNFPTKGHWRMVTRLDDIVKGLEYLLAHYKKCGIESLAVPPLGCAQGQLEWRIVGPTLYRI